MWIQGFEWTAPEDAVIQALLEQIMKTTARRERLHVLEIGVHTGAFPKIVLMNNHHCDVVGVDPYPYPAGEETLKEMEQGLTELGVISRYKHFLTTAEIPEGTFDVIHVDGEHTETALAADLRFAASVLAPDGILVIDDVRHRWFPGVIAATWEFILSTDFLLLADTGQKFYLVRGEFFDERRRDFRDVVGRHLDIFDSYTDFEPSTRMSQPPDVKGHPVFLVQAKAPLPDDYRGFARKGGLVRKLRWIWARRPRLPQFRQSRN